MSHEQQLFPFPAAKHIPASMNWVVDVIVLDGVDAFLADLRQLTGRMELVVDRLAESIVSQGAPGGSDPAMRAWMIYLLAREAGRSGRLPGTFDPREVVLNALFDLQADLEACLDPSIGSGDLSRRAAGLLLAMVVAAAGRSGGDGKSPVTWHGIEMRDSELSALGEALFGVQIAGREPFRLVRTDDLSDARHPVRGSNVWNMLELAGVMGANRDYGLVVVPRLDILDESDSLGDVA